MYTDNVSLDTIVNEFGMVPYTLFWIFLISNVYTVPSVWRDFLDYRVEASLFKDPFIFSE